MSNEIDNATRAEIIAFLSNISQRVNSLVSEVTKLRSEQAALLQKIDRKDAEVRHAKIETLKWVYDMVAVSVGPAEACEKIEDRITVLQGDGHGSKT